MILIAAIGCAGFASFIAIRGIPKFEANVPTVPNVIVTPERVEKGAKIAAMLCQHCHLDADLFQQIQRHCHAFRPAKTRPVGL